MTNRGIAHSPIVNAAIFILLEVAAIAMLRSSSTLQDIWLNRFSHRTLAILWGWSDTAGEFFSLRERNDELAKENFELRRELDMLKGRENQPAVAVHDSGFKTVHARVVRASTNSQHNYIILDKGRADGVKAHSGIITQNGAVGIVDAVSEHFCYGLTLMNNKVSVSSRVGRNGMVVPLVWDGIHTDKACLNNIPLTYTVNPGDTVWTSGLSSIFPGDIALGLASSSKTVGGAYSRVTVDLFQDFSTLKYVTITSSAIEDELRELEEKEGEI